MGVCKIQFKMRFLGMNTNEGPPGVDYTLSSLKRTFNQQGYLSNGGVAINLSAALSTVVRGCYVRLTSAAINSAYLKIYDRDTSTLSSYIGRVHRYDLMKWRPVTTSQDSHVTITTSTAGCYYDFVAFGA